MPLYRLPDDCPELVGMERVQFDGSRTFSAGQFRLVRVREGGINGVPEVESPAPQVPCLFCWHENEPSTVALLGKGSSSLAWAHPETVQQSWKESS